MSKETLEGFFKHLAVNKEAQAKAKSFGGDVDALVAYARELGYDVSPEELRKGREKAQELVKARVSRLASLSPGAQEFAKFIELSETDEAVGKRLSEIGLESPKEVIAFGKEKGFTFNEQDMKALADGILDSSDELSDEDLELAAGGCVGVIVGVMIGSVAVAAAVAATALVIAATD